MATAYQLKEQLCCIDLERQVAQLFDDHQLGQVKCGSFSSSRPPMRDRASRVTSEVAGTNSALSQVAEGSKLQPREHIVSSSPRVSIGSVFLVAATLCECGLQPSKYRGSHRPTEEGSIATIREPCVKRLQQPERCSLCTRSTCRRLLRCGADVVIVG